MGGGHPCTVLLASARNCSRSPRIFISPNVNILIERTDQSRTGKNQRRDFGARCYHLAPAFQHRRHGAGLISISAELVKLAELALRAAAVKKGAGWMILFSWVIINSCVFGGHLPVFLASPAMRSRSSETVVRPNMHHPIEAADFRQPESKQLRKLQPRRSALRRSAHEVLGHSGFNT